VWASGAKVVDSIVFDGVHIGKDAVVRRAILDKEVVVDDGATVGVDPVADRDRGFTVTDSGITVVGKGIRVRPSPPHVARAWFGCPHGPLLVVLDVDSTLIENEVIELLAEEAGSHRPGRRDHVPGDEWRTRLRAEPARAGGDPARRSRIRPRSRGARRRVEVTQGRARDDRGVQASGGVVGVVSGGFHEIIDPIASELGLDLWRANRLEVQDGDAHGALLGPSSTPRRRHRPSGVGGQQWHSAPRRRSRRRRRQRPGDDGRSPGCRRFDAKAPVRGRRGCLLDIGT
jgi:hypothetical protein